MRVGDEDRRPGVVDLRERGAQGVQVMTTQVADRADQGVVVEFTDQRRDRGAAGALAGQPHPELVGGAPQQSLVLGVGHVEDPGA